MVAPIDATATFEADGETFALAMTFRTIALAEDTQADVVTSFGTGKPKLSGLAALVWAFAQPAHPDLTQDAALALVMRHGAVVGAALGRVFAAASAKEGDAGAAPADPPKKGRRAASTA